MVTLRPADLQDVFRASHAALVRTVVPLVGGSREAAEDVVGETFARAHRQWATVGRYDRPDLWLRRVALNLATSARRTHARRRDRLPAPGPEAAVDSASVEVLDAVRALPDRQAQLVVLVYFAGESVAGAARVLGISEATARTHQRRALATLARTLTEEVT